MNIRRRLGGWRSLWLLLSFALLAGLLSPATGAMAAVQAPGRSAAVTAAAHTAGGGIDIPKVVINEDRTGVVSLETPQDFYAGPGGLVHIIIRNEYGGKWPNAPGPGVDLQVGHLHHGYSLAQLRNDVATALTSQPSPTLGQLVQDPLSGINGHGRFYAGYGDGPGYADYYAALPAGLYFADDLFNFYGAQASIKFRVLDSGPVAAAFGAEQAVYMKAPPGLSHDVFVVHGQYVRGLPPVLYRGYVLLHNSTTELHEFNTQPVVPGATYAQILTALNNQHAPNPFAPGDSPVTGVISPGVSIWWHLTVKAGWYAILCFIPDLDTGMPHSLMGMIGLTFVAPNRNMAASAVRSGHMGLAA